MPERLKVCINGGDRHPVIKSGSGGGSDYAYVCIGDRLLDRNRRCPVVVVGCDVEHDRFPVIITRDADGTHHRHRTHNLAGGSGGTAPALFVIDGAVSCYHG